MKRFIRVYLTMFVAAILATNLVLILIYGQRFLLNASADNLADSSEVNQTIFLINGLVVIVFAIFWGIASHYHKRSKEIISIDKAKEW